MREQEETINIPRLVFITAVLAAGASAGSVCSAKAAEAGIDVLMMSARNGSEQFRWLAGINLAMLLVIYLCSFFSVGSVPTLLIVAAKGFIFSAPLTESIKKYGINGYFKGEGLGSLCALISVVAVMTMAMQAIEMSSRRRINGNSWHTKEEDTKNTAVIFMAAAATVVFGAAADAYLLK